MNVPVTADHFAETISVPPLEEIVLVLGRLRGRPATLGTGWSCTQRGRPRPTDSCRLAGGLPVVAQTGRLRQDQVGEQTYFTPIPEPFPFSWKKHKQKGKTILSVPFVFLISVNSPPSAVGYPTRASFTS